MKKNNKILLMLVVLLVMPFGFVKAEKTTYFKADDTLKVEENVDHNLFLSGNKVTSNSKVNGILFMVGNSLKTKKSIEYGALAGNNITIVSDVEKDLFAAGNDITVEGKLGRDAYIAGNTVSINNDVDGNLFITSGTIELSDTTVKGNVYLACDNIVIGENVTIKGTLRYNEDAKIEGLKKAGIKKLKTYKESYSEKKDIKEVTSEKIVSTLSLLLVALIISSLLPRLYQLKEEDVNVKTLLKKALNGLITLVLTPIACVMLLISIIGLPLGIIGVLLYGISVYISITVSSALLGKVILSKFNREDKFLSIVVGVVIMKIVLLIPYIGPSIYFLFMLVGLGYILDLFKKAK